MRNNSRTGSEQPEPVSRSGDHPASERLSTARPENDSLDPIIQAVAEPLRAVRCPDLEHAVMARIAAMGGTPQAHGVLARGRGAVRRLLEWAWRPRPVTVYPRPAHALAMAGLVLALAVAAWPERTGADEPAAAPTAVTQHATIYVQFRLDAPHASRVALAGSFTDWEPRVELRQMAPGVWSAVVPLPPGVHDYLFVVDAGSWVPDPHAHAVADGFGGVNSRVALLPPTIGQQL